MKVQGQKARNQRGSNLIEVAVAVLLLTMVALLISNIFIIYLAKAHNDRVCYQAVTSAARASIDSRDTNSVIRGAYEGMTLGNGAGGGFFIHQTRLGKVEYRAIKGGRSVVVQTQTNVRLPAPILVFNAKFDERGELALTKTYEFQIKESENASQQPQQN